MVVTRVSSVVKHLQVPTPPFGKYVILAALQARFPFHRTGMKVSNS